MSGKQPLDFKNLSDPYDDAFIPYLLRVPQNLSPRDSPKFFKIVLSHFNSDIPKEIGNSIMMVIRVLIRNEKIRDIFVTRGFADQLPFKNRYYVDESFCILNELVKNCAEAFDEQLTNKFASILTHSPSKSLSILCSYAKQFNDLNTDNPWPMIDILIQASKYFTKPNLIQNYSSILIHLCSKYPDYRSARGEYCWNILENIIETETDVTSLDVCYNSLAALFDYYKEGEIPTRSIKTHLNNPEILDSVLSFLAVLASVELGPNNNSNHTSIFNDTEIIKKLLSTAKTNVKATLVLMKASSDIQIASFVLGKGEWLITPLPLLTDTLRLFLVIFGHQKLRRRIVSLPNFIPFLKAMTSINNSGVVTIICTVLRRVSINQEMLDNMSSECFLDNFFQTSIHLGDQVSLHSFLLLLDTLSKVGFTSEFVGACEKLVYLVKNDQHLNQIASYVAADLCKYEKCALKMKKLKLDEYFSNHLDDPQISKGGQKFLNALEKLNIQ
ncbi:hypothetical protein M9Y10_041124 [Tritrichomonas musculus]|uniref:Uncharacterized protein n=1 Tax=Tritrichomonas musculus TaxID=1915356 RepID=A0ABR2K432_9EUKA